MRSLFALMLACVLISGAVGCHHTGEVYEAECCDCACDSVTATSGSPTLQILNEMPPLEESPLQKF
jgi:hypothetical protein